MGEVITAKDKEYEAEERKSAPGDNQSMSDRVNNRSLRPQSPAFKDFMKSGWADDDPEIKPLESSKYIPARLEALGKAFPGERLVIPAGQPKVRNNDCDYAFRPDTTFAYYTGLGSDYEAGAVLVLNPVDLAPPKPEPVRPIRRNCSWLRAQIAPPRTSSCPHTMASTGWDRAQASRKCSR